MSVESVADGDAAGTAQAFQFTATSTGTSSTVYFYVDQGNLASLVHVGIYSDSGNLPNMLLGEATISNPLPLSWDSTPLSGVSLVSGTKYWIAILSPAGGGEIDFRDKGTPGLSTTTTQTNLTALPTTWSSTGAFVQGPLSAYVVN